MREIPFNKPYMTGKEFEYIQQAHKNLHLAGDGPFSKRCHDWLESNCQSPAALLTHSCTAALEMTALLLDLSPGDEVIMPSYTFVSTANAFALRGAKPVFVDIRKDTLNIDETLIEQAITKKTKAIVPVHYAGISCEMDHICNVAKEYDLSVIEDAAQGIKSYYKGKPLGSIGDMGTLSFHETKNVISGEGGALLVNTEKHIERAEIIREKGTDRSRFFRGQVDKYTWQDIGSSFLPGEVVAAFLWAQLQQANEITHQRLQIWKNYHQLLESAETSGLLSRPVIPKECEHNAHMYYVVLNEGVCREAVLSKMAEQGVNAVFHYVPLHNSPAGQRAGRSAGKLPVTLEYSARLVRLPLWVGLTSDEQEYVCECLLGAIGSVN